MSNADHAPAKPEKHVAVTPKPPRPQPMPDTTTGMPPPSAVECASTTSSATGPRLPRHDTLFVRDQAVLPRAPQSPRSETRPTELFVGSAGVEGWGLSVSRHVPRRPAWGFQRSRSAVDPAVVGRGAADACDRTTQLTKSSEVVLCYVCDLGGDGDVWGLPRSPRSGHGWRSSPLRCSRGCRRGVGVAVDVETPGDLAGSGDLRCNGDQRRPVPCPGGRRGTHRPGRRTRQ